MNVKQHKSIREIDEKRWRVLAKDAGPFLSYEFLCALEKSGSVNNGQITDTGWTPDYLTVSKGNDILAVVPAFVKHDSYGEYVFDHAWANAYAHHGLSYYPKWVAAIPFTPVTGPRLLVAPENTSSCIDAILAFLSSRHELSSCHWLFCSEELQTQLNQHHYLSRYSVQFQWRNKEYKDFDDFLAAFTSRKRKDIRKERKAVRSTTQVRKVTSSEITSRDKAVFYLCYQQTYLKRSGHQGYLTEAFFDTIFESLREQILLVIAEQDGHPIASALFFYDRNGLYGRYWGALKDVQGLHFECCYYQGIEFAIENKLSFFNPGTQGEHKLLRGFEPLICHSAHALTDTRFHEAVDNFLQRETPSIVQYYKQAQSVLPFNQPFLEKQKDQQVEHVIISKIKNQETEKL